MRVPLSFVVAVVSGSVGLAACTPKPPSAQPVVEDFLAAVAAQNFDGAAALTDRPGEVSAQVAGSWSGLQAEGLRAEVVSVKAQDTIATATYELVWDLPRDREFRYEASMTLNRVNGEWGIRWQPAALHPRLASNQHLELRAIQAPKSSVVSSDGAEVLVHGTVLRVLVNLDEVQDRAATARAIAAAFMEAHHANEYVRLVDVTALTANLQEASGVYSVATVNMVEGAMVRERLRSVPGVVFNEEAAMVPTEPGFAPDIISRVASLVSEDLSGTNGWQVATVTPDGVQVEALEKHDPVVRPAVKVSLDHRVQLAAEEAVNTRKDAKTMLVAMRASTGEVLAIAQSDLADAEGDLALNGQYPPGSTMKIITAAAGMQHHGLQPGSIVPCPGTMNIYGRVVTNYNNFSLGSAPLQQAFARSCNTTFADISTQLDAGQLKATGAEFGLGVDYSIPGLTTITGSIPVGETALEKTEAGYGQGLTLVSPFGMALVSATAATGRTPTPTLISGHETTTDQELVNPPAEVIEHLRQLMGAVTEPGGTAAGMAAQANGKVFAKTGEAEITGGSHAWFTGYRGDIAFATLIVLGGGSEHAVAVTDSFFTRLDELGGVG